MSPLHLQVELATLAVSGLAAACLMEPDLRLELRRAVRKLSALLIDLARSVGALPGNEPKPYLPVPYRPGRLHGEAVQEVVGAKSLLLEVIRRAASDWVLYRTSRRLLYRQLAEDAFIWLFQETPGHNYWRERRIANKEATSFLAICEALDFDPESVRKRVRTLTPQQVMSMGRPAEYRRRQPSAAAS